MNTKVYIDILKENWGFLAGAILFLLLGILVMVLPDRSVDHPSLQTKEVAIDTVESHYGGRGSDYHVIRTTDGERYVIKGSYQREQLAELLTKGTIVTIKWYESDFGIPCAEEVYVNGERVVEDNDDLPDKRNMRLIVGAVTVTFGLGGFFFVRRILVSLAEQKASKRKVSCKHKKKKQ